VTERIDSLDTLKGLAILFVVYIHSKPFFSSQPFAESLNFILANSSRFAVPAFFLTSGFLLSTKISKDEGLTFVKRQMEKIGTYYIFTSAIYILPIVGILYANQFLQLDIISNWLGLNLVSLQGLFNFLYIGKAIAPFLWFFTALFYSIATVYFFSKKYDIKYLVLLSGVFHVVAILSNIYQVFDGLPVPMEDAVFFGLFFTSTGFWIGKDKIQEVWSGKAFLKLTGVFFLLHLVERGLISSIVPSLNKYFWDSFYWGPYSFFTAPMAIFFFLYILNRPDWGKNSRINLYGKYTLTGYIIHPMVIGLLLGLSIGLSTLTGLPVRGTVLWDLVLFPLAALITMETAVKYQSSLNSFIERVKDSLEGLRRKYTGF
jgi:surface polysaccharide O-acyltransferase-like enzyme